MPPHLERAPRSRGSTPVIVRQTVTGVLRSRIGLGMPRNAWSVDGGRWRGPKRGNFGSKGDRAAQTQRQAEKRKLARAKRGLKRTGRRAETSWGKRRLVGKQTPLGKTADARAQVQQARALQKEASAKAMALEVETEQARQLAKESTAKAEALELEKEAALQDVKTASCLVAAAKKRTADALNYADRMLKSQGKGYVGAPFLGSRRSQWRRSENALRSPARLFDSLAGGLGFQQTSG